MAASRSPLIRLRHIQDEIDCLTRALDGVSFEEFRDSYVLRRTAEHAVLIISEAVKALPSDLTMRHPNVDWRAIRDIGNVVRHEYFHVDANVIWRIASKHVFDLGAVVAIMISELT